MKKTILITGGAGFLGTNLMAKLANHGHHIIILDDFSTGHRHRDIWPKVCGSSKQEPYGIEWIRHDVLEPFFVQCDEIYHLACPASPADYQADQVRTTMVAVQGTYNALMCAEKAGARIVIASTSEVYGEPLSHPQSEDLWAHINPVGPRGCYDAGKAAAESLARNFSEERGVEVRIARIHNTYGPFMSDDDGRMIPNFINQALNRESLTVYGDGSQTRSLCYVDDMVDGLMGLMANDLGEGVPVNLGTVNERTVLDIARSVIGAVGFGGEVEFEDLPGDDPTRRCPDIGFAKRMFNFDPKVSMEGGLEKTVEYFRKLRDIS